MIRDSLNYVFHFMLVFKWKSQNCRETYRGSYKPRSPTVSKKSSRLYQSKIFQNSWHSKSIRNYSPEEEKWVFTFLMVQHLVLFNLKIFFVIKPSFVEPQFSEDVASFDEDQATSILLLVSYSQIFKLYSSILYRFLLHFNSFSPWTTLEFA